MVINWKIEGLKKFPILQLPGYPLLEFLGGSFGMESFEQKAEYFQKILNFDIPSKKVEAGQNANQLIDKLGKTTKAKIAKKPKAKGSQSVASVESKVMSMPILAEQALVVSKVDGPAASREELQARLKAKLEFFKTKRGADTLKNQTKQAKRIVERANKREKNQKKKEATKEKNQQGPTPAVVIDNGRQIFSKFDFGTEELQLPNVPGVVHGKTKIKAILPSNPKQALQKLYQRTEQIKSVERTDKEKAEQMKKSDAWVKAIQKSQGLQVKDDAKLLKKSIQRMEKGKEKRTEAWEERKKKVEEGIQQRQQKRADNIQARKDQKKGGKRNGGKPGMFKKPRPGFEGGHFRKAKK